MENQSYGVKPSTTKPATRKAQTKQILRIIIKTDNKKDQAATAGWKKKARTHIK